MLDSLSTAVLHLDGQGYVRYVNSAAEFCFDMGRERMQGGRLTDFHGVPEDLLNAVESTARDRSNRHLSECRLAGGWYDCNISTMADQELLLEFYDLTWHRQQAKLQQREIQTGMMDLLRRNLGHEIRNPLGGIRGAAQMMATELEGRELGTLARLIMREVDRIDELMARFGQPELEYSPLDLHYILQETIDLLHMESAGPLNIVQDYDPSIPRFDGDASALRQLFLNLLKNALQAGATDIRLRSRIEPGSSFLAPGIRSVIRLDIEDNGCGVPESLRDMLFLPLVTGRRDGTGLGLALAQQVAAAHHGLLSYDPLEPGSRFTLRLPVERNNG